MRWTPSAGEHARSRKRAQRRSTISNSSPGIGCAGAGILGSAIIRRLLERGFAVGVWNRNRQKLSPLVELGAVPADTPADLAVDRHVVLTCVTSGEAVEAIVFGTDGVAEVGASDKLLIDMSMKDLEMIRDLANTVGSRCRWPRPSPIDIER